MPARPLLRRLLEQCRGRVVRSDIGWVADAATAADPVTEQEFTGLATTQEWSDWAKAQTAAVHVQMKKLFVDYLLQ
jgi:hypothetical protein